VKKFAIIIAIAGLFGTPALAADMAVKAPPPPPPAPIFSWTGWYAGLNAGVTWSNNSIDVTTTNLQFCDAGCGGGLETALASAQGATGIFSGNTNGLIGGGQFGYNWQFNSIWVAGFEADIQGVGSKVTRANATIFGLPSFPCCSVTSLLSVTKENEYLGTVRGRLGWLATPNMLVYGTGGLAYGGVKASTRVVQSLNGGFGGVDLVPSAVLGVSQTRTGWTAGGGLEFMIAPQWSAKVEYMYYDLGRVTFNGLLVDAITTPFIPPNFFTNNVQTSTHFNGNIVRVGLNYQFPCQSISVTLLHRK
jgi:outer membrane immunogenic protein